TLSFFDRNSSSLLDLHRGELVALDAPFVAGKLQSVAPAQNETGKWFFAEFPMIYDPCTCNFNTKLFVHIENIVVTNIQLNGSVSGQLVTNNANWAQQEQGNNFAFSDGIDAGKKYVKFFSTMDKFITDSKKAIEVNNIASASAKQSSANAIIRLGNLVNGNLGLLKTGIRSVPYVNLALSALDIFTTGGNSSPQKVSMMPMTLTADLKIQGTLVNETDYSQLLMYNPGSPAGNTPSQYSKYNEVLGVFNLLETPELTMTEQVFTEASGDRETESRTFKLAKPIKYVLNPASGLEVQDVQLAFTMRNTDITNTNNFTNIISTTDFVDGFRESPVGFYRTNSYKYRVPEGKIAVKIILNLRRKDGLGENILSSVTFPAKFTNAQTTCTGCFAPASLPEIKGLCQSAVYQEGRLKLQRNNGKPPTVQNINFTVAPNPANDVALINYEVGTSKHVRAYITDITGRIVSELFEEQKETGNYSVTVPTLSLNTGMYLFVLEADGERHFQKVFINHSF
ncbi:MAG: hypothetical protein RIS64_3341, partial [Bacteroidota bacterium]